MLSHRLSVQAACCALLALLMTACGDANAIVGAREVLADGTVVIRYGDLSAAPVDTLSFDLVVGRADGEAWETFGRITGLAVDDAASVYVLDSQAFAVRIFGRDGSYRSSVGRGGDGPGEFRRPTGLLVAPNGMLWVRDQGARRLTVLSADGREAATYPMPADGSGSTDWDAVLDSEGRILQSWRHTQGNSSSLPAGPALLEWPRHQYVRSFDPSSGAADSVLVGEDTQRTLFSPRPPSGFAMGSVPFDVQALLAIGDDATIWTAASNEYRAIRRGQSGDSPLIIQLAVDGPPASQEQRTAWQSVLDRAQVEMEVPQRHQTLLRILTDDRDHLWIQRSVREGEPAHFDAFTRDGQFLGSVRVAANLSASPRPVIRGGHFYAVILGDFDVPQVIRAPLPEFAR